MLVRAGQPFEIPLFMLSRDSEKSQEKRGSQENDRLWMISEERSCEMIGKVLPILLLQYCSHREIRETLSDIHVWRK